MEVKLVVNAHLEIESPPTFEENISFPTFYIDTVRLEDVEVNGDHTTIGEQLTAEINKLVRETIEERIGTAEKWLKSSQSMLKSLEVLRNEFESGIDQPSISLTK